jgi:hypothetical protein
MTTVLSQPQEILRLRKTPLSLRLASLRMTVLVLLFVAANVHAQSVIVSPAGGEEIAAGSVRAVSWNKELVTGMLTLSLWDGEHGKWSTIWANVPSEEGSVKWSVPEYLEGKKFRIKLSTTGTMTGSALTRTFFTISPPKPTSFVARQGMIKPILCTVHPNPISGMAKICVEELPEGIPAAVEVVDARGETIAKLYDAIPEGDLGLCMTFDCRNLPSGTYFAHVMNEQVGRAVKISVQH